MKHIIRKPYVNYEKEEKWLNEMSARGLALRDYTWCRYVFEDAPKGEYIYRIELLEHPVTHPESQNYIRFLEETGIEFVTSYMRWVYFRKKAADGPFDIYSDIDSKLIHYKRVMSLWLFLICLEFFAAALNIKLGISNWYTGNFNFYLGLLLIPLGCAFIVLVFRLGIKIRQLKKEKNIRES